MKMLQRIAIGVFALLALGAVVLWQAGRGFLGSLDSEDLHPRTEARSPSPPSENSDHHKASGLTSSSEDTSQILFGDLHVHTTISFDAFMLNLPIMGGQGAHTPADACDFARHCAALDFYSLNDHAANILPIDWENSIESIRSCNARAEQASSPDMVAFLGWEWTQAGLTPETHYGHKNIVLAHTDADRIPTRPIAATAGGVAALPPPVLARGALAFQGPRFSDLALRWTEISELDICPEGDVRSLPADCREIAETPRDLFNRLDQWGHDAIVIPHGTTWGIYTPPASNWDHQLRGNMHDPQRQRLFEIYSGHGASEVYRDWRAFTVDEEGNRQCPPGSPDYLPICRRASQIIKTRCLDEGEEEGECAQRAEMAARYALEAGPSPHLVVPGTNGTTWLDSGQCRDCDQPAFKYRPAHSAQYVTAIRNFDAGEEEPRSFRMGFIGSSDIHTARAGSGFKEIRSMTDAGQKNVPMDDGIVGSFMRGHEDPPEAHGRPVEEAQQKLSGFQLYETERTQSFLYTGGLVAVHAPSRDGEGIWTALENRTTYGTNGPRILLFFDAIADGVRSPMGSELSTHHSPRFEARAVGSFEQMPGCPETAASALGPELLERLCRGECYNPGERRRPIRTIEVIRIRPQVRPDEDVGALIEDPWLAFNCAPNPEGCRVEFEDPDFAEAARDTVYYIRALESPIPTVNGDPLSCEFDDQGRCIKTTPCVRGQECLSPNAPRAWSSPIFVDHAEKVPGA